MMKGLRYTQKEGFVNVEDFETTAGFKWSDGKSLSEALVASDWGEGYVSEEYGYSVQAKFYFDRHQTKCIVDLDFSGIDCVADMIFVDNYADLMSLRLVLAPLLQLGLLEEAVEALRKKR